MRGAHTLLMLAALLSATLGCRGQVRPFRAFSDYTAEAARQTLVEAADQQRSEEGEE